MSGDDTTVMQAVLACDTERLNLLKEEQALLKQLNDAQPNAAQPNGMPDADKATANGHDAARGVNGAAVKEAVPYGISKAAAAACLPADAAETKAAAQLAQVCIHPSHVLVGDARDHLPRLAHVVC